MERAPKKHMGLLCVALSAFFLFNPVVALVDILPDIVGYLLLLIGTMRLSDLSETIGDAARRFRIMIAVGAGEILAWYLTHISMNARIDELNRYEYPAAVMLFTFLPMLLRFCFLLPAFRDLFRGLEVLCDRFGCDALCKEGKKGRSAIESIAHKTRVFLLLQGIVTMLPELGALTCYFDPNGEPTSMAYWYRFISLYRTFAATIVLIVGIVWLVSFFKFLRLVLRQKAWLEAIHTHYCKEILTQTMMLRLRRVQACALLLCIGLPFAVSLRVGGLSVLPGAFVGSLYEAARSPRQELKPSCPRPPFAEIRE